MRKKLAAGNLEGKAAVDAYLASLPLDQKKALTRLRKLVRAAAPNATERFGYGMPGFYHEGALVYYSAFKEHLSFFAANPATQSKFAAELAEFPQSKGTIRFWPEKQLPAKVVTALVKARVKQNEARKKRR